MIKPPQTPEELKAYEEARQRYERHCLKYPRLYGLGRRNWDSLTPFQQWGWSRPDAEKITDEMIENGAIQKV